MDNNNMERTQPNPELENKNQNPYEGSRIVDSLLHSDVKRIAFVDIDSTFTGTPEDQKAAREALEQAGYQVVHVTSRTPEMTIGSKEAAMSPEFNRPAPKLLELDGESGGTIDSNREKEKTYATAYPDQALPKYDGIYNPVATLASTGTEIWIQQQDGSFRLDKDYEKGLQVDKNTWRSGVLEKINTIQSAMNTADKKAAYYPKLEEPETYFDNNQMDVAPPDLRVQVNFDTFDSQVKFTNQLQQADPNLRVIEDGHPFEEKDGKPNPRVQVYVTPANAGKEQAVEQFFQQTLATMNAKLPQEQQVQPQDIETLFIGDSWPDVAMGLLGAKGSKATLLLVGGSRITQMVGDQISEKIQFASEDFTQINDKIIPQSEQGHYVYEDRTIVTGEAFPGTKAPQTIKAFIESQK